MIGVTHDRTDVERRRARRHSGRVAHVRDTTFPKLEAMPGHRGAYALRRRSGDRLPRPPAGDEAVTVITLWDSIDAIARFSGADVEAAVVPPEAQALLVSWDARAVHWEVAACIDNPVSSRDK